jgi:hypothetical protein
MRPKLGAFILKTYKDYKDYIKEARLRHPNEQAYKIPFDEIKRRLRTVRNITVRLFPK